jgi:PAS domain S-box-containing protein
MATDVNPEMNPDQIAHLQAENDRLQHELAQVQQSESYYRQIFENAPISMLSINLAGYITHMNPAAEALYGLPIETFNQQAGPVFDNPQLVENGTLPYMLRAFAGETVIEEPTFYDASRDVEAGGNLNYGRGHYFPLRDPEGKVDGIVEIAADFKDFFELQERMLVERDRATAERNRLLSNVAEVANCLLKTNDYATVLPDVVRLLGEAVGSDRCCITQETVDPSTGKVVVKFGATFEIVSVPYHCDNPEYKPDGVVDEDPPSALRTKILQGEPANFLVSDLPSSLWKAIFEEQKCTSLLIVPIMVQGRCWGQIGFDNCGEPKLYDEAEIAILRVAADSIAAAIERQIKEDQLRESEAHYRTLFEISSEGIYRFEFDQPIDVSLPVDEQVELIYQHMQIAEANMTHAEMYGKSHPDEVIGLRLTDVHTTDSEPNQLFVRALIENDYRIQNAESEEVSLTGTPCFFINNVVTMVQDGYAIGGWGSQLDITELRMAQQSLLQAEQDRVAELAQMNDVLKKGLTYFTETTDLNAFLGYILQEAAQQTGACAGHIFVYDTNKDTLEMCRGLRGDTVYSQALMDDPISFRSPFPISQIGPLAELCDQRSLMLQTLDTTAAIPDDIRTWHQQQQHHQLGTIALMAGTQLVGRIGLAFNQPTTFKPETLELLNILIDQASLVIHLTQLAEERRQSAIIQERNYTAREIHDTLAQDFGGILIQLQAVDRFATTNPTKSQTHRDCARDLARKGLAEARSSIWVLSQEGEAYSNLAPVLGQLAAQMTLGSDTQAQVTVTGSPLPLPPEQGMHLLRIVQEACNNALRHAQAAQIQIQIGYGDGSIELRIIDDGVGFEVQRSVPGFGLKSMQQRAESIAAILQISSELNQGTEVRVMMPIETEPC